MDKKELRFNAVSMSIRTDETGMPTRCIDGTAIVFNSQSELLNEKGLKFYETIKPEAVTQDLINSSDIAMLYNHDSSEGILARSKKGTGTLSIALTQTGVDFSFNAPCSPIGDNVLESVKRGDLDACSFAFYVKEGGDVWQKVGDVYNRTINAIASLVDFSIVFSPAYTATVCNSRGLNELIESETALIDEEQRLIEEESQRKIDKEIEEQRLKDEKLQAYYANLNNFLSSIV